MKPLSAMPHAVLDYLLGLLLMISPWLFGFGGTPNPAMHTMTSIGILVIALSLITNYPLGIIKLVPFPVHGIIETLGALVLLSSPWVMGFPDVVEAKNLALIAGVVWLGLVVLTNYSTFHQTHRPAH